MYNLDPITPERVLDLLRVKPKLKQPQILDELRGPLDYYTEDGVRDDGEKITAGDVIPRPFLDLEDALRSLRRANKADFQPKGSSGGWIAL